MKAIICIIYLLVIPLGLGRILVPSRPNGGMVNLFKTFVFGFILFLASSFIPAIIAVFGDWTLTRYVKVWTLVLCALLVWALVLYGKDMIRNSVRKRSENRGLSQASDSDKAGKDFAAAGKSASKAGVGTIFLEMICAALLVLQLFVVTYTMHVDDDDVVYVGAAATSVDTDTVFHYNPQSGLPIKDWNENTLDRVAAAPLHVLVAGISRASGVRPAVLCHTVLPPLLTLVFFLSLYLIGGLLFQHDRLRTALFTIFAWLAILYSGFSVYTSGIFLATRSWQGKGIFCGLIIPAALFLFIRLYQENGILHGREALSLLAVSMTAALATSMGAALLCMMAAVWLMMLLIRFRHFGQAVKTALCFLPALLGVALYFAIHYQILP